MRNTKWIAAIAAASLSLGVAACGDDDKDNSSSSSGSTSTEKAASGSASGKKIALLLPESKTARYESQDRPLFEAKLKELCSDCQIIYSNADQDAAKQQQQAEAAITQGANVLVLDPVDGTAAASIVAASKAKNIPVFPDDRFIAGTDFYVSFDDETVGKLQAQTLVDLV